MCLICVEFQQGKLTFDEAIDNAREMKEELGEEHLGEIVSMLFKWWAENLEAVEE